MCIKCLQFAKRRANTPDERLQNVFFLLFHLIILGFEENRNQPNAANKKLLFFYLLQKGSYKVFCFFKLHFKNT